MGKVVGTALVCAALLAGAASAQPAAEVTVGCGETAPARVDGARVVLGAVVLSPPRELERSPARAAGVGRWRWFQQARIAVRDGESDVSVSVPLGWRDRVAVSWGRSGSTHALRFDRCAAPRGWSVYEGGFHLRKRGDCVPLAVRVGGTSTTVRLGVGRACGSTSPA